MPEPARVRPSHPISVVVAPAGFGKTTLANAWLAAWPGPSSTVRTAGPLADPNAITVGLALIAAAVELGAPPEAERELTDLLPPGGDALGEDFARRLQTALFSIPGSFLLVIEDVHRVPARCSRTIASIVDQVADRSRRFLITSRSALDWPVERWRVAGRAVCIGAGELRLGEPEVAEVLGERFAHLAPAVVEATTGWAAAVQMVRWQLVAGGGPPFAALGSDMAAYVRHEVLPLLPELEVVTLTRLAPLDGFSLPVAEAVTGIPGVEHVLGTATRATSLITFDEASGRFSIHPTLREGLRRVLHEREPGREPELRIRAADVLLGNPHDPQSFLDAIELLLEASAWPRVVGLLRDRWMGLETRSRLDLVVTWLDRVPIEHWNTDASLLPLYLVASLQSGRSGNAFDLLQSMPAAPGDQLAVIARLACASSMSWAVDPDLGAQLSTDALTELRRLGEPRPPPGAAFYPGVDDYALAAEVFLGQARAFQGRTAEALAIFQRVLDRPSKLSASTIVAVQAGVGWCHTVRGEQAAAERELSTAARLAAEAGLSDHVRAVPLYLGASIRAALAGDPAGSRDAIERAARISRTYGATNLLSACDLACVLSGADPDYGRWSDLRPGRSAFRFARQVVDARLARQEAARGRPQTALIWLTEAGANALTLADWVEVIHAARGRSAARHWLAGQPPPTDQHTRLIRLLAQAATVESGTQALELVSEATTAIAAQGLPGVLLRAPAQLWHRPGVANSADPLLQWARERMAAEPPEASRFTRRELDLLELLPSRLTIGEIADRLFITVSTLKWHRARIYRKLDASDRASAVARAIELGIVSPSARPPAARGQHD